MRRDYRHYLALTALFTLYLVWLAFSGSHGLRIPCFFKALTGIPCPGCGTTRALELLLHGHGLESVATNPLGLFLLSLLPVALVWMTIDYHRHTDSLYRFLHRPLRKTTLFALVALTLANWLWNILKGL